MAIHDPFIKKQTNKISFVLFLCTSLYFLGAVGKNPIGKVLHVLSYNRPIAVADLHHHTIACHSADESMTQYSFTFLNGKCSILNQERIKSKHKY
jgi:nitroimidazol reductase NimA-like FMN-containing flavoprotein (pyridoxamine 5'-phosphate oxidase superfamily)